MAPMKSEKGQAMAEYMPRIAGMMLLVLAIVASGCVPNFAEGSICPLLVEFGDPPSFCCDQGRGNGDDDCTPGNSDSTHDPNDPQKGKRE